MHLSAMETYVGVCTYVLNTKNTIRAAESEIKERGFWPVALQLSFFFWRADPHLFFIVQVHIRKEAQNDFPSQV